MLRKKELLMLASFLFLFLFLAPFVTAAATKGIVTADVLNVRKSPSLQAEVIGTLKKNTEIDILREVGDWLEIQLPSKKGYVYKPYVTYRLSGSQKQAATIYVNGKKLSLPVEPVMQNNRIHVPYRAIAEALGIQVEWNQTLKQVTAIENDLIVVLTIGQTSVQVNGNIVQIDSAPMIVNSYTLIPIRFFAETFGAEVHWDQATKTVTVEREGKNSETNINGYVTAYVLNVRSGPSTSAEKIGELTRGTKINIIRVEGDWIQFDFKGRAAYVHKDYVDVRNEGEDKVPIAPDDVLNNKTIVLDPGHGGSDPGTVHFDLKEKDIVLNVGLLLEKKLKESGANVIMTRIDDRYVSLEERVRIANANNPDTFVSIHVNSVDNVPSANGTETYWNRTYSSEQSRKLANEIQKQLISKLQTKDRGIKEANFYVIRYTKAPSVLVELGFLSNEDEAKRLNDPAFQELAAEAIYEGLKQYFQQ